MNKQELLRNLPQIDVVLDHSLLSEYPDEYKDILLKSARQVVDELRNKILNGSIATKDDIDINSIVLTIKEKIEQQEEYELKRIINCTGVILHTNLGRARLSERALENVKNVSCGYSNLEYDLKSGQRGSRHDHIEKLLKELVGVEAAIAVNNNAAATMLCLSALAEGKKSMVSRGELVEIGGSFRIPDILKRSGSILCEVGTTNKTKPQDYIDGIDEDAGILLKVHTSNYRIVGFTTETSVSELSEISLEYNIPLVHDLGSGLIDSLTDNGIDEISVKESLKDGSDVVLFSGDKMLGGPQCGIIAGKKKYIDMMKKHPLARVFRVDKMTLAALEGTLHDYLYSTTTHENNPTLRMITYTEDELQKRATDLKTYIEKNTGIYTANVIPCEGQIGGGSAPLVSLSGFGVTLESSSFSAQKIERMLRKQSIPVIVRIADDKVLIDVRTVHDDEFEIITAALKNIEKEV